MSVGGLSHLVFRAISRTPLQYRPERFAGSSHQKLVLYLRPGINGHQCDLVKLPKREL
jgi:hypothetical protein